MIRRNAPARQQQSPHPHDHQHNSISGKQSRHSRRTKSRRCRFQALLVVVFGASLLAGVILIFLAVLWSRPPSTPSLRIVASRTAFGSASSARKVLSGDGFPGVPQAQISSPARGFPVQYPLPLPLPIIVVGLPKAGTSSIFSFFAWNGIRSQHYYCCNPQYSSRQQKQVMDPQTQQDVPIEFMGHCLLRHVIAGKINVLGRCGNYDVYAEINGPRPIVYAQEYNGTLAVGRITDTVVDASGHSQGVVLDNGKLDMPPSPQSLQRLFLPQHSLLQTLLQQSPNATWILNLRPVEDWIHSVLDWNDMLACQLVNEFASLYPDKFHTYPEHGDNALLLKDTLRRIWDLHIQHVRQTVLKSSNGPMILSMGDELALDQARKRRTTTSGGIQLVEVDISDPRAGTWMSNVFGLQGVDHWQQLNSKVSVEERKRQEQAILAHENS